MPNMLSETKTKITYAEDIETRLAIEELAAKQGKTVAELMREITQKEANVFLRSEGRPLLRTDTSSTPGGVAGTPKKYKGAIKRRKTAHA